MDLRKYYSVTSALFVAVAVSSCSTHTHLSHTISPAMPAIQPAPVASADEPISTALAPQSETTKIAPTRAESRAESARAKQIRKSAPSEFVVRTTAYSHQERDSWKYGKSNAAGGVLKHTEDHRSAAADWSRFPLGTRFKIDGLPQEYVVEDYGSALVGSDTIDIYKPSLSSMKRWGTRHVGIKVLEWGSFSESERILKSRAGKAPHVRQMLEVIQQKIIHIPEELRDGFSV
ncbi:MAG: hypothetical protein GXP30_02935 [Verrucomicrobia bacterium]|nr:hypothetical protein [Verrucomicrobiota bacterium]